jgi:hypothetical protein
LVAQGQSKRAERGLGCAIDGHHRVGNIPKSACDVHDPSARLGEKLGQERRRAGHQRPKIRVDLKIAEVERSGLREVVLSLNSRVVDEAIHGTEIFWYLFRGALKRRTVRDIKRIGLNTRVGLADFPKGLDTPSRYYDPGALASERLCEPSANSGTATGDEAAFAGKFHAFKLATRWRSTSIQPDSGEAHFPSLEAAEMK